MKRILPLLAFCLSLACAARADSVVVFNEVMYHPATNEAALEWVELRNPLTVDVDLSDWSISGTLNYSFPSNSIIRGGAYLVVARSPATMIGLPGTTNIHGPFTNRLDNAGGLLRLRNNAGRVMDEVNYGTDGDWPVAPDGSGMSLAKSDRDSASGPAANWTWSEQFGGTPGADNFPLFDGAGPEVRHVAFDSAWKHEASGTDLGAAWRAPGYIDTGWASRIGLTNRSIPGLFNTGVDANKAVLANAATDTHYVLPVAAQGTVGMNALAILNHPNWSANDAASSWIGVSNPGANNVAFGAYWYRTTFDLAGFIPGTVQVNMNMQADNQCTNVMLNGAALGLSFVGFGGFSQTFTIINGFTAGANSLEFRTLNDSTAVNPHGFRALLSGSGLGANTNAPLPAGPSTYYFRKSFNFSGDPAYTTLRLSTLAADGAVFYLNGTEIHRQNLPGGAISYATPALSDVASPALNGPLTIAASNLVIGMNVLAVEVHQAAGGADAALLGAELVSTALPAPPVLIAFNEQSASTNAEFWLELHNYATNSQPLGGAVLALDGETNAEFVLPAVTVGPGGFLALTNTTFGFLPSSGNKIYLYAPGKARVYDAFVVKKGPRARSPNGTGPWLHPSAPTPGEANIFDFRDEIVINEIMYHHRDIPGTNSLPARASPEAWIELYNRSAQAVVLTGWELDGGVRYNFAPGKTIGPFSYLVVADNAAHLRGLYPAIDIVGDFGGRLSGRSDRIVLRSPDGNPADEVRYFDGGRWPGYADGGGSSLELRDPSADNSKAEAWAASDESAKTGWQNYTYRVTAAASSTASPDALWREFVFGLLGDGECLVDDISVIQSPTTSPVQFISNGNFENGVTGWRIQGNQSRSRVVTEPGNPANHVLHLIATGPQEHMNNHIEGTFLGANAVVNGNIYDISYRAKHLAGNNLLNTRLYFNRCARTTALPTAALNGTPGAVNSRYTANIGPTFSGFGHTRVVPSASEAVSVSVVAEDPQGVASCEARYSVNGAAFVTTPMTNQGGGRYTGVIPGQSASAIVQFYVRAVDGLGAAATFPAAGPDGGALYKVNDGQALLGVSHNFRIVMTAANTSLMHDPTNVMSNDQLPCTIIVDEKRAYYDASVRLKSSEHGRFNATRVGFHLEFPSDDLFRGVHPVLLLDRSNVNSPPAEEILVRHIALRAGVPMPHPDICRVIAPQTVNTGTAILSPRHEDDFIETAYENGGDGTMFELELTYQMASANAAGYKLPADTDGVAGLDISDLGTNKEPYRYNFMIKNHRGADDFSRFISFARSWSLVGATLEPLTSQTTDWDQWMRNYSLVSLFSVNDMYTFGNNHNLMAYVRPSDGRMHYFLWDMDFSLTSGRGATAALIGNQNLGRIVTAVPSVQRLFYGHMLDHIDTAFNGGYMGYWVDRYDDFVPGASYAANTSRIQQRADFARGQIAGAGGNAAFAVNGANFITTGTNLVTLTGTAPVQMKTIKVNGIEYAVTWTSLSAWVLRVPVGAGVTALNLVGSDVHDRPLTNFSRTITVDYTGPAPAPEGVVVLNEIHYNPAAANAAFVEVFNRSTNMSFDLSGWRINGLDYEFPPGAVLTNRGFLVVANDPVAYFNTYTTAPPAFDRFSGNLDDNGETLSLLRPGPVPGGEILVDRVRYEAAAPWPANANGFGPSLQLIDAAQDNVRVSNWLDPEPPETWRRATLNGTVQAITGTNLFLWLAAGGEVYIDDITLTHTNQPPGVNFLQNGGFEDPLTGPWVIFGMASGTNHGGSQIVSGISRSGTNSLRVVATAAGQVVGSGTNAIRQTFPAFPTNTPCTLSFWFLPSPNVPTINARTLAGSFLNGTFTDVQPRPPRTPTPGATNSIAGVLPAFPPVWLNEAQPDNLAGLMDAQGEREPWVEIHNAGTTNVLLDGWYLADNYSGLEQWAFPSNQVLLPGEFKIVFCDGETNETTAGEWHTSFRLTPTNGSVALSWSPSGVQLLDYLNYAGIRAGRAYGDFPDAQPFYREEFYRPTPGSTNDNVAAPLAVFINEWMARNTSGLFNTNNNNEHDDWFEIHNPHAAPADLSGYFLTDDPADPFRFQIPSGTIIPPQSFLLVWADGQPGLNTNTDPALHVSFKLEENGEAIALRGGDGVPIDAITFGPQYSDVSEGRYPDGPAAQWIAPFTAPTPAAPNAIYANRYPALAAIPDATAYVNLPFQFTADFTDPDAPPQLLAFSLDPGAPTNATLHVATGKFSWTPTAAQSDTTNVITLRVADNGTPVLRAGRTFTVVVRTAVLLGGITAGPGGAISFTVVTTPGKTYHIEYKNDLNETMWTHLPPDHPAGGTSLTINDTIGAQPQRFYRVVQLD